MWDFPQYTSMERAFNISRGTLGAGAGAEAGVSTSKTALRILHNSFLE